MLCDSQVHEPTADERVKFDREMLNIFACGSSATPLTAVLGLQQAGWDVARLVAGGRLPDEPCWELALALRAYHAQLVRNVHHVGRLAALYADSDDFEAMVRVMCRMPLGPERKTTSDPIVRDKA